MSRTALILGAGLGGLVAAGTLRKLLPTSDRVIAVDRAERHFFPPSLLWLMVGERKPEDFTRSLDRLIGRGVEFRHGEVTRIDAQRREIEIAGEPLAADALVIALGAEYAPEAIPGLAQAGLNLYTMDGAIAIRDTLARFEGGRIVVLTAAPMYKCPAAPYEAALLLESHLRKRGVRGKATIEFFAAAVMSIFMLLMGVFVNAPLEELANPIATPAVAKAPWYLVGIQELLVYFHPTVAGAIPILTIFLAIGVIPYIDRGPRGDGGSSRPADRKLGIVLFTMFAAAGLVITFLGAFFRGPGLKGRDRLRDDWRQVANFAGQRQHAGLDAGDIDQIADKPVHPLARAADMPRVLAHLLRRIFLRFFLFQH